MSMFRKAQRSKAKVRLFFSGPSGSGKTWSSLIVASGLADWDKIAVIDTENGSADLYAHLGEFSVLTLEPPYSPEKYIQAIKAAEQEGFEVIIVDSLTHAWSGEGGILDQQGKAADAKYKGNSWSAWREFTPKHNQLVETMLKSKCHVIATMRSKMDYLQTEENGKKVVKKVGMNPIQRDGMEYEFTLGFDLSIDHIATASKDRTGLFDGKYFKPDQLTGKQIADWFESGAEIPESVSELQRKRIGALAKDLGAGPEMMVAIMQDKFGVDHTSKLTAAQAGEFIADLESRKAAAEIAATMSEDDKILADALEGK